MKKILAPSILAANFANLEKDIAACEKGGVSMLHLDVMDGSYVPNISFGAGLIQSIRKVSHSFFDAHLMVKNPERHIEDFAKAGVDSLTIHVEATAHPHRAIQMIKEFGLKAAISLNPSTSLSTLDYLLEEVDMVLVMSVNPGFEGQAFIPSALRKIAELRQVIDEAKLSVSIQVDGGVKRDNARELLEAGSDILVVGSDVFGVEDITSRVEIYQNLLSTFEAMR